MVCPSSNRPPDKADQAPVAPADVWLVGYYRDNFGITQRLRKTSGSKILTVWTHSWIKPPAFPPQEDVFLSGLLTQQRYISSSSVLA